MTNLHSFIQGSLEWPFTELFSANVSLWNQYKYIAFNIFSCRILIISCKMLIITWISNEKANELAIYGKLCRNVKIFYRQELASLFQVQEKVKACRRLKLNFLSSCFIADGSHTKIVWLNAVVFSGHDILFFLDNVHLFKYYPVKVHQNCFNTFNCSIQTCMQVSKFSFAPAKKNDFKVFVNCRNETKMIFQKNAVFNKDKLDIRNLKIENRNRNLK